MTIKTLTHIHNLLIEAERVAHAEKELFRKARNSAEDNNDPNLECIEAQYNKARDKWLTATNALDEFESHDWS